MPWWLLFGAAVLLALAYVVFAFLAFDRADDSGLTQSAWLRMVSVFQGIEAIAFTAIGWLFGREVHRGTAEAAKGQAEQAKQVAQEARAETEKEKQVAQEARAERGEARQVAEAARAETGEARAAAAVAERDGWRLAEAVRAHAGAQRSVPGQGGFEGAPEDGPSPADGALVDLKDLADSLFPRP